MRGQDHEAHARTMARVVMALAFLRRAPASQLAGWGLGRVRRLFGRLTRKTDVAAAPGGPRQIRRHDPVLWESVVQAVIVYVPRAYGGSVSLLLPPELSPQTAKGWGRFVRHVEVVKIPGDHRTCVTSHVETLGSALDTELSKSWERRADR